jgi:hypothetical protein
MEFTKDYEEFRGIHDITQANRRFHMIDKVLYTLDKELYRVDKAVQNINNIQKNNNISKENNILDCEYIDIHNKFIDSIHSIDYKARPHDPYGGHSTITNYYLDKGNTEERKNLFISIAHMNEERFTNISSNYNALKETQDALKEENSVLKEENADLKNRIEQMEKKMNTLMEFMMLMK